MPNFSLINTSGLSKPATILIEKISNAVGTLWEPRQTRRVAQAKADAAMILANSDIEIDEVKRRAAHRFVDEETRKQLNMEGITRKALQNVNPNAPTEGMEDDWITNFFDKCRSVSNEDMQSLWSRILSGEANAPGSFSRKTVNLVADLDKSSAELFRGLCGFGWQFDEVLVPIIFDFRDPIYTEHGLSLFSLAELDAIGLIQIGPIGGFTLNGLSKTITAGYHERSVRLTLPKNDDNSLGVGKVMMTPSGKQLSLVAKPDPINGFFEFICDRWAAESLAPVVGDQIRL